MDQYFIVAEIEFPDGVLDGWLSSAASPDEASIAEALDAAEGDLLATAAKNRVSIRASLVDHEFFAVKEPLEAAFARAARLGASGQWHAGGYFAGTIGTITAGKKPVAKSVKNVGEPFRSWFAEAYAYSEACMKGTAPARKPLAVATATTPAAKSPSARKTSPKKPTARRSPAPGKR